MIGNKDEDETKLRKHFGNDVFEAARDSGLLDRHVKKVVQKTVTYGMENVLGNSAATGQVFAQEESIHPTCYGEEPVSEP